MMPLDELLRTEDEGGASAPIGIQLRMEARAALSPDAHEGHPISINRSRESRWEAV